MKEGYLQNKISELNEELEKIKESRSLLLSETKELKNELEKIKSQFKQIQTENKKILEIHSTESDVRGKLKDEMQERLFPIIKKYLDKLRKQDIIDIDNYMASAINEGIAGGVDSHEGLTVSRLNLLVKAIKELDENKICTLPINGFVFSKLMSGRSGDGKKEEFMRRLEKKHTMRIKRATKK